MIKYSTITRIEYILGSRYPVNTVNCLKFIFSAPSAKTGFRISVVRLIQLSITYLAHDFVKTTNSTLQVSSNHMHHY